MPVTIFDLDGTLTPARESSRSPFEQRLLKGVLETCARLEAEGVIFALATNQRATSDIFYRRRFELHINWLLQFISLKAIRFASSPSRLKPRPAMLLELIDELGVAPSECIFVGDSAIDCAAAAAAGIRFEKAELFFSEHADVGVGIRHIF